MDGWSGGASGVVSVTKPPGCLAQDQRSADTRPGGKASWLSSAVGSVINIADELMAEGSETVVKG